MKTIIQKLSNESKQSINKVTNLLDEISCNLIKEGCEETDPRFLQYLVRRARKRLKIQESKAYKTFKEFFKDV